MADKLFSIGEKICHFWTISTRGGKETRNNESCRVEIEYGMKSVKYSSFKKDYVYTFLLPNLNLS